MAEPLKYISSQSNIDVEHNMIRLCNSIRYKMQDDVFDWDDGPLQVLAIFAAADELAYETASLHIDSSSFQIAIAGDVLLNKFGSEHHDLVTPSIAAATNPGYGYGGDATKLWSLHQDRSLSPDLIFKSRFQKRKVTSVHSNYALGRKGKLYIFCQHNSPKHNQLIQGDGPFIQGQGDVSCWSFKPFDILPSDCVLLSELLAGQRLDRGRYVSFPLNEARDGWATLKRNYPDVFTIPIDKCLHLFTLKDDWESIVKKHQHAALFAANFDCRDRPTEPHPFVARGRLFTVLGDHDKAAADFAMAWKLGGTGWVKSECRRMVRDTWRLLQAAPSPAIASPSPLTPLPRGGEGNQTGGGANQAPEMLAAYRKLQIAATYLEQDPRTLAIALLGKPPLHRLALAIAKQRLGIEWDERDRAAMASLLR